MTRAEQLATDVERALWDYLGDEAAFTPEYPALSGAFAELVRLAQREDPREVGATSTLQAISAFHDAITNIFNL